MAEGSYLVGPQSGRLLVKTTRTGLGAKAGHDLTIEVTRWHGNVLIDAASLASSSVTVEADVGSFEVREEPAASSRSPTQTAPTSRTRFAARSSTPGSTR